MGTELSATHMDLDTSGIQNTKGPFTDIDDFLSAVKNAQAGDLVILANGSYNVSSNKDTSFSKRKGTATKPIIVRAQDVGGAILKGSAGYEFDNCEHFTWYGFNHTHKGNITFKGGKNNRFARCEVKLDDNGVSKTNWLRVSNCRAMKVDHCFFHHKKTKGNFCNVAFDSHNTVKQGPLFEYNHFLHQDLPNPTGDAGGEAVKIGDSKQCRTYFRAIFRYNYLEKCDGDGEIITNKSSGNIYYNNSFVNNDGSLTLRHGDSTAVLGNCFEGNNGLRVGGADNLIANNHFTRNSNANGNRRPLVMMNGNKERPNEQGANNERVVNNDIILNTFANRDGKAKQIVRWGSKDLPKKPTGNRFRGNIITARNGVLLKFDNGATASGNTITDNIGFVTGSADFGDLKTEMATRIDPLLTRDSDDSISQLQSASPARGKIQGTPFSSLATVDIYGVDRSGNTDVGCHQHSTSSTRPKKRITREDVGPKATTSLDGSPAWNPHPEIS